MEFQLDTILRNKNLLKLKTNEYLLVTNRGLKNLVMVMWDYRKEELLLMERNIADNVPEEQIVAIQDEHYLVLDSELEGYERGILLTVNFQEGKLNAEEILKPQVTKGNFKIVNS